MLTQGSKRRRPPAQIKAEREAKQAGDAEMQAKLAELKAFELHIERQKESLSNKLNAEAILSDLVRNGVVKDFGGGEWGPAQDFEQ